jgi:hypothetical protein
MHHSVEKFAEIDDTLVVGQRLPDDDERVVMFIKMHNGYQLDAALIDSIRSTIRRLISAKHIPAIILPIDDIPVGAFIVFSESSNRYLCSFVVYDEWQKSRTGREENIGGRTSCKCEHTA